MAEKRTTFLCIAFDMLVSLWMYLSKLWEFTAVSPMHNIEWYRSHKRKLHAPYHMVIALSPPCYKFAFLPILGDASLYYDMSDALWRGRSSPVYIGKVYIDLQSPGDTWFNSSIGMTHIRKEARLPRYQNLNDSEWTHPSRDIRPRIWATLRARADLLCIDFQDLYASLSHFLRPKTQTMGNF